MAKKQVQEAGQVILLVVLLVAVVAGLVFLAGRYTVRAWHPVDSASGYWYVDITVLEELYEDSRAAREDCETNDDCEILDEDSCQEEETGDWLGVPDSEGVEENTGKVAGYDMESGETDTEFLVTEEEIDGKLHRTTEYLKDDSCVESGGIGTPGMQECEIWQIREVFSHTTEIMCDVRLRQVVEGETIERDGEGLEIDWAEDAVSEDVDYEVKFEAWIRFQSGNAVWDYWLDSAGDYVTILESPTDYEFGENWFGKLIKYRKN